MNSKPQIEVQRSADSNAYSNTFFKISTLKDGETQRFLSEGHNSECSISVRLSGCLQFIEASNTAKVTQNKLN